MKSRRWIVLLLTVLALSAAPYQTPKGSTGDQSDKDKSAGKANLIDINSASADELKSLPGIGDDYASAIINNRPFDNKRQLVTRNLIPQATYERIAVRIIARPK
jgi:DNA uptake protein ComE-like DNA-binding protein